MDIGASFGYMFQDEDWIKKIIIGGIVGIIPIVNFAAIGYMIQIIRNVRAGQPLPLPEWDEFGQYFMDGLWIFLIILVWSIPALVVACLQGIGGAAVANNNQMSETYSIISACFGCLIALWSLVVAIFAPAIMIRFAEVGDFMAGFRFGDLFNFISLNVGSYVIVLVLMWVASLIASLGVILCVIGVLFTQFWAYLVSGHLLGQLAGQNQVPEPVV